MARPYFEGYADRRKRAQILILGAYSPNPCMARLQGLRDYLRSIGYERVQLVADFPDEPGEDGDLKSERVIMSWAAGVLFVFLSGCNNAGVSCEVKFMDRKIPSLFHTSFVLVERGVDLSGMVKGPLGRQGADETLFSGDAELHELAAGSCAIILRRCYSSLS
jgi:hypothetical protein